MKKKKCTTGSILMLIAFMSLTNVLAQTPFKSLNYIYSISGTKTISGQHNDQKSGNENYHTERIHGITGAYPGVWGGDFSYDSRMNNRWNMIYEAERQWNAGAIVSLMWHPCPPTQAEPCNWDGGVKSDLTDAQWNELITNGTTLNTTWKSRLDKIAVYLQYLEDKNVEVFWRPYHEMNQGNFWWGGRSGTNGTRRLYQLMHDYFVNVKGLTNLVWLWNVQDLAMDWEGYNPGSSYWDMITMDVYSNGLDASWYNYMIGFAGSKPMGIGECAKLPTPSKLAAQPRYTYFMGWADLVFSSNTTQQILDTYNAPQVFNRNEMPGWSSNSGGNLALNKVTTTSSGASASAVDGDLTTRWSAEPFPQWLQVDLGASQVIGKTEVVAYQDRAYQFTISAATSPTGPFTQIVNRSTNTTPGTEAAPITDSFAAVNARYIRINITGAANYTGTFAALKEFRVFAGSACNVPAQPATITGNSSVVVGSSQTYSVPAVSGATSYTWTLPSGWTGSSTTNSITTTAGNASGNVSVRANNACGSSATRTLAVTATIPTANVALNKTTTTSSGAGASAVDGNLTTRWSADVFPQWLQVDLGATYNISKTEVVAYEGRAYRFTISLSTTATGPFTTVVNRSTNTTPATDASPNTDIFTVVNARYVRINITGAPGYTGTWSALTEFRVFGTPSSARITNPTSTEDEVGFIDATQSIVSFPNPVTDQVTVQMGSYWQTGDRIALYNGMGKALVIEKIKAAEHTFDLSNLAEGLYIINLSNLRKRTTHKILKK